MVQRKDRRSGLPPIPSDVTASQRQFFEALRDNLAVRLGQVGDRKDAAVTFRDLEDRLARIRQLAEDAGTSGSGDDTAGFLNGLSEGAELSENDLVLRDTGSGYNWASAPVLSGGGSVFSIASLFVNGERGAWFDPSDLSTLFQDTSESTQVFADGDPVALMKDKSGNGLDVFQSTSSARPVYRTDGSVHWLDFDGNDWLESSSVNAIPDVTEGFGVAVALSRDTLDVMPIAQYRTSFSGRVFSTFVGGGNTGEYGFGVHKSNDWRESRTVRAPSVQGAQVFLGDWNGEGTKSMGAVQPSALFRPTEGVPNFDSVNVPLEVGSRKAGSDTQEGKIFQLVVLSRAFTMEERQKVTDEMTKSFSQ